MDTDTTRNRTGRRGAGIASFRASGSGDSTIRAASHHPTRRGMLRGTAAMAMAGALVPIAALTRPAAAQADALAGRDLLHDKRPVLHDGGTRFGAYDPHGDYSAESAVVTEHLYLPWENADLRDLDGVDDYAFERGRKVMLTIEPWAWGDGWTTSAKRERDLILSGARDANMRAILNVMTGFRSPLIIRWAQEMDGRTGHFPWQDWAPADYVAAYRRMAGITRELLPDAQLMWSPKGEPELDDYYPGEDVVDLVGLSVFGLQEHDEIKHGAPRSFAESLRQGYALTEGYGKPIWVAELGYEGELPYLTSWADDVTRAYDEFPMLEEVTLFNAREVHPWPHGLGLPDWRVVRDQTVARGDRERG